MSDSGERWSIDRRAPLALVVTVLIQAGTALVWAGATSARINELEVETRERAGVEARTIRLEEQVKQLGIVLDRIEVKLDRIGPGAEDAPGSVSITRRRA